MASAPTPQSGPARNRVVIGAALLAAVLVLGGLVLIVGGGDDGGGGGGEVILEPISSSGPDPFSESVGTTEVTVAPRPMAAATTATTGTSSTSSSSSSSTVPEGATSLRSVQGSAPGLYGGTRDNASCDPEKLIAFLQANPDKAKAWADVQGIQPAEIPEYIRSLTPLVLRADTRVTNHGFRNGKATPRQAVLQAGTAVLVDKYGIPRAKCGCGNPLLPPKAQSEGVSYTGDRWPEFKPENVMVVVNTTNVVVNQFVVVNLGEPGYFTRKPGLQATDEGATDEGATGEGVTDGPILIDTFCDLYPDICSPPEFTPEDTEVTTTTREGEPELGTGDLQVTLRWFSSADLDLAVTDPTGATAAFVSPATPSGGQLDVDSNGGCSNASGAPVENVFWPAGAAPDGDYTVTVTYYTDCPGGGGAQEYELTVLLGGQPVEVQLASVVSDGPARRATYALGDSPEVLLAANKTIAQPGTSQTASFRKDPIPPAKRTPGAPEGLTATVQGGDKAKLTWSKSSNANAGEATGFTISIVPGGTVIRVGPNETSRVIPGLRPGTDYQFNVEAVNANGSSPAASASATTPPAAGGGTTATTQPSGGGGTAPPPKTETLQERCDRLYGPPPEPGNEASNIWWTLCMHDPLSPFSERGPQGAAPEVLTGGSE